MIYKSVLGNGYILFFLNFMACAFNNGYFSTKFHGPQPKKGLFLLRFDVKLPTKKIFFANFCHLGANYLLGRCLEVLVEVLMEVLMVIILIINGSN